MIIWNVSYHEEPTGHCLAWFETHREALAFAEHHEKASIWKRDVEATRRGIVRWLNMVHTVDNG